MQAFDLFLYAVAIIAVLLLRATPATAIEAPTTYGKVCLTCQTNPVVQTTAPAPAMAQTITAPVATLTIPTESSTEAPADLASLTSAELRRRCQSAGVKWRNAHGTRHLSKAEMVQALAA